MNYVVHIAQSTYIYIYIYAHREPHVDRRHIARSSSAYTVNITDSYIAAVPQQFLVLLFSVTNESLGYFFFFVSLLSEIVDDVHLLEIRH